MRHMVKQLEINIHFPPKTFPHKRFKFKAPDGKIFNEGGIENALNHIATMVEEKFPMWNFRFIPVVSFGRKRAFNYVYDSLNDVWFKEHAKQTANTQGASDGKSESAIGTAE